MPLPFPQAQWMVYQRLAKTHDEAVRLGNALCDAGYIQHVTKDHGFRDAHLFYRITEKGAKVLGKP